MHHAPAFVGALLLLDDDVVLAPICDITGQSYESAQTIVKHYRARNPDRANQGIDALVLQVRQEGMTG
jgi:hypothetical protein